MRRLKLILLENKVAILLNKYGEDDMTFRSVLPQLERRARRCLEFGFRTIHLVEHMIDRTKKRGCSYPQTPKSGSLQFMTNSLIRLVLSI